MKGMKGRFLRNLKLIPTISNLNQSIVVQLNAPQVFCVQECPTPPIKDDHKRNNLADVEVGLHGSEGDHKHPEEEGMDLEEVNLSNKDKATPTIGSKDSELAEEKLDAPNLSDTNMEPKAHGKAQQVACSYECPSLTDLEELCPPGGSHSIILYTTSMRGIRKTFQDCNTIRFLLRSFKVKYHERDVSLHLEYREELWKILGGKVIPPKLFIKGRYIGGADEVVGLHEMGWLGKLLEGTPTDSTDCPCVGCANMRFAICSNCSGSRKVFTISSEDNNNDEFFIRCPECNENGLVKCPICC